ncbi:TniQ family protein [Geomonas oryzae]|uniref:TniQ family protein n=1 Tax=Geomonas oryzae TaxID=2364273 RepID=UPI00100BC873|nr:TniQ family protein [Geomonas oryzae]
MKSHEEYEALDLTVPVTPRRSRLYNLKPIGIGTPFVESLTSYIVRLSNAHCVNVSTLVAKEIAPFMTQTYSNRRAVSGFFNRCAAINEFGMIASTFIRAIENLTLRKDIIFLTMSPWEKVLTTLNLSRQIQAWCPVCYAEWRKTGQIIYFPLLWTLDSVTVCPRHYQKLETTCPFCNNYMYLIEGFLRPGFCAKCNNWLGTLVDKLKCQSDTPSSETLERVWLAEEIGTMLAFSPQFVFLPNIHIFAESLRLAIKHFSNGNSCEFARLVGVEYYTLRNWIQTGYSIPRLCLLGKICRSLGKGIIDFILYFQLENHNVNSKNKYDHRREITDTDKHMLFNSMQKALKQIPPPTITEIAKKNRISSSTIHHYFPNECKLITKLVTAYKNRCVRMPWETIEHKLLSSLKNGQPPLPLKELAKQMCCNKNSLYKHFPEICYSISKKFQNYKRAVNILKKTESVIDIRETATKLYNNGIYPSISTVSKHLNNKYSDRLINETLAVLFTELQIQKKYIG